MLVNFTEVQNIFIVCGDTDVHCEIDGLAIGVSHKYNLNLLNKDIFLFYKKKDRYKVVY